tara:strand:+ start:1838 stop:2509 length:672 start_codon:yes stop_codon:yes gene_type:complete
MMLQLKNKKILIYVLLFFILATFNNKHLLNVDFPKINQINVNGLSEKNNLELKNDLSILRIENLFILKKYKINKVIDSYNLIESYSVFKKYPSTLNIKVDKTNFLAKIKNGQDIFLLGSNGKLIKLSETDLEIPSIFGDFKKKNFFELKEVMTNKNFDYSKIKSLFFFKSGRWDIELHSGLLIKLPKDNLEQSFEQIFKILKKKQNKISVIDLRQQNQIIING